MKKLFERNDLLIIMAVCVITIILLLPRFFGGSELTAEITVGGETVKTLNLDEIEGMYEFKTDTVPAVTIRRKREKSAFRRLTRRRRKSSLIPSSGTIFRQEKSLSH